MFGLNKYQLLCLAYITFGSAFYGYDSGKLPQMDGKLAQC